jgi:hypothetical protein
MAKVNGLGLTTLSIDDSGGTPRDVRNDLGNFGISTPRAVQDVTGLDKSANERLLLLADYALDLAGFFNTASNQLHAVARTFSSTSVNRTVSMTMSGVSLNAEMLGTDYQVTRADGGAITTKIPMVLADGAVPTWS